MSQPGARTLGDFIFPVLSKHSKKMKVKQQNPPIKNVSNDKFESWKAHIRSTLIELVDNPELADELLEWNWENNDLRSVVVEFLVEVHMKKLQHLYIDIDFIDPEWIEAVNCEVSKGYFKAIQKFRN